jgi:hypothetical protein
LFHAFRLGHGAYKIMIPDRGPTNGHDHVGIRSKVKRQGQRGLIVARNRQKPRLRAEIVNQGRKPVAVGGNDLVVTRRLAGLHQFVPCCDDCDGRATAYWHLCDIHGGQKRDIGGREQARGPDLIPDPKISPCRAHVRFVIGAVVQRDHVALAADVFLNNHMVGAVGQGCAGEDAQGFTGSNGTVPAVPCGCFTDDLEGLTGFDGATGHGIAIHRRGSKGRLATCGLKISR